MTGRLNITAIRARARNGYSDLRTARADVIALLSFAIRLDRHLLKLQTDRVAADAGAMIRAPDRPSWRARREAQKVRRAAQWAARRAA